MRPRSPEVLPPGAPLDSAEATRAFNALEGATTTCSSRRRRADAVVGEGDPPGRPGARGRAARRPSPTPNALERLAAELLPPDARRLVLLHPTRGPIPARRAGCAAHHRHAPSRGARRARRRRAALPLRQRHGARPRRLRRRRLLRGPHRTLQGADAVGADVRHHGRHLGRRGDDRPPSPWAPHPDDVDRGHARHLRHQQGHAALHVAALQPARPHAISIGSSPTTTPASTSRICGSPTSPSPPTCRVTACTGIGAAICGPRCARQARSRCCCRPTTHEDGHMLVDGAIAGQRADAGHARAEERAERRRQLRGAEAASASRSTTARCRSRADLLEWHASTPFLRSACRRRPASAPC